MVIDSMTMLTGSFNFTKAAEEKNAENLLIITDAPELVKAYEANIHAHAAHAHPYTRGSAAVSSPAASMAQAPWRGSRKPQQWFGVQFHWTPIWYSHAEEVSRCIHKNYP